VLLLLLLPLLLLLLGEDEEFMEEAEFTESCESLLGKLFNKL